jgi:hypothetical protein
MNLAELIRTGKGDRSYEQLARDCGGRPTAARIHQIATGQARSFPDPPTIRGLARGLRVTEATVVLAAAEALGLDARLSGSRLETLLPAGIDNLTDEQVNAVLAVINTMLRAQATSQAIPIRRPSITPEAVPRVAEQDLAAAEAALAEWDELKLTGEAAEAKRADLQADVNALKSELLSRDATGESHTVAKS